MKVVLTTCLVLGLLAGFAGEVRADKARATELFSRGLELYKQGMYLDALEKFKQARSIYPSVKIDLNIGSTLAALGKNAAAATYVDRVLLQKGGIDQAMIKQVSDFMVGLKKKVGSVRLTCPRDGATVKADGKVIGLTPLAIPIYLEPGEHTIEVTATDHLPLSKNVKLDAGQHISMDAALKLDGAAPPVVAAQADPIDAGEQPGKQRRFKTILAYSALGAGAALVVGAVVMYGIGFSQGDEAYDKHQNATSRQQMDEHYDEVEAAKTKVVVGHVFIGLGVAAAGVGLWALLTRPPAIQDATAFTAPARPAPGLAFTRHGGAVFTVSGQF